jgi:SPX domain protein involved in polyphosphate accumulation
MSYLRLNYIGKSSLRLVIKENEKKEPDYIMKYQYQSKIRQKPSSTPPAQAPRKRATKRSRVTYLRV